MQNIIKHLTKITNSKETKSRAALQTAKLSAGHLIVTDGRRLIDLTTNIDIPQTQIDLNTMTKVPDINYPNTSKLYSIDSSVTIKPVMPLLKAFKSDDHVSIFIHDTFVTIESKAGQPIHSFILESQMQTPAFTSHFNPKYLIELFECLLEFPNQEFKVGFKDTLPDLHPIVFFRDGVIDYVLTPIRLR